MTLTVTHPFVSAVADGTDTSVVRPSGWNASHNVSGNAGTVVANVAGTAGAMSDVPINTLLGTTIDLFMIGGQSNSLGRNLSAESPTVPSGKVLQVGTAISDANDPINNVANNTGVYLGGLTSAWPTMGTNYYNATGRKIAFVQTAVGGSAQIAAADGGNGNWSSTGLLRGAALTQLNAAITVLQAAGYSPVFKGIIWWQGEEEALGIDLGTPGVTAAAYSSEFAVMRAFFRSSTIGGTTYPTLPFYMIRIGSDPTVSDNGYSQIRAAQNAVVQADLYTYLVWAQAYDLGIDMQLAYSGPHLLSPGYLTAGAEIAKSIVAAQGGAIRRLEPQVIVRTQSTITVSTGTPGTINWASHGLVAGSVVSFTSSTTGGIPAGLAVYKAYWVSTASLTANTFQIADTQAHALAGTNSINISSVGSGTLTGTYPAGANAGMIFNEGPVFVGTPGVAPSLPLFTVNTNVAPVPILGNEVEVLAGQDNAAAIDALTAFGSLGNPNYSMRHGGGTMASPTYPQANEIMGQITWNGWDGTNNTWLGAKAAVRGIALNTWASSDNSTFLQFLTTPGLNITLGQVAALYQGLIIGSSSGSDPGLGKATASGFIRAQDQTAIPAGGTQDAGFLFSATSHFGLIFGSGAPTATMAQGTIYARSDGVPVARAYVNSSGAGVWAQIPDATYSGVFRAALTGINFHSSATDNPISIPIPSGISRYAVRTIRVTNASTTLGTGTIGVFTATGGGGVAIASDQAASVTLSSADANGNLSALTTNNVLTTAFSDTTLQIRIGTASSLAATADVVFELDALT